MADIASRFENNPLIRPSDVTASREGLSVVGLFNPGVFHFDGKVCLLLRVAEASYRDNQLSAPIIDEHQPDGIRTIYFDRSAPGVDAHDPRIFIADGQAYLTTLSHLRLATSTDGRRFIVEKMPTLQGEGYQERYGIEDSRVSLIDGQYFITYTAVSADGVGVKLITTSDWKTYHRKGMILPPHNKDCVLFPSRINDFYYCLHRPSGIAIGGHYMWLSSSPDGVHWGHHHCLIRTRPGSWDSVKVGAGGPPIEQDDGWLVIYHAADENDRYCLGALLLDKHDPTRVLARSHEPIMEPVAEYEKQGFYGNVVFSDGHLLRGDELYLYYGASDEFICGATLSITQIRAFLAEQPAETPPRHKY